MRALLCATAAVVVVTGCGKGLGPPVSGPGYKLYEAASTRSSQLVAVIDTRSGSVERTLPWGVLAGRHFYSVSAATLSDIDPRTGSATRTLRLPGIFQLPLVAVSGMAGGLSQDTRWLVLEHPAGNPDGTDSFGSHLLVVDTSTMKVAANVDLAGRFNFDAISNDGQRIYLIEYVSDAIYRVRFYDVGSHQLDPTIVVDKSNPQEKMIGIRLSGVASADGQWLYSVYARPNQGAFIHALNLNLPYAFCLELPGAGYSSNANELQWSLALGADGTRLFAANGSMGIVVEIHNDANSVPSVIRTAHIDSSAAAARPFVNNVGAKELNSGAVVLSPDGLTLVFTGKTGLIWLDTVTLHARSRQLAGWRIWSLGLSPDGSTVYALNDAATIAELSMSNPGTATTFGASGAQPIGLIRVDPLQVP